MLLGQRAAGSFHPVEHGAYSTISGNSVESPCAEASHTHVESSCIRQFTKIANALPDRGLVPTKVAIAEFCDSFPSGPRAIGS